MQPVLPDKPILKCCCIFVVLLITLTTFYPVIDNGFTNWDDDVYVVNNINIRTFSSNNIFRIFGNFHYGSYIPLTIISFALNYSLTGASPLAFHITNLILHTINIILVFWFIYLISNNLFVSLITATLFAIHPLNVEPVAWITGRKDLLYGLFFMIALIFYCYYLKKKDSRIYYLVFLSYIFALLSKPSAISLPLVLVVIDYLHNGKFKKGTLINKIPFIILAIIFSFVAFYGQSSVKAIHTNSLTAVPYNIMVAANIILFYLYKTFIPINLSCYYPGPERATMWHPIFFMIAPIMVTAWFLLAIYLRKYNHKILGGSLFFLCAILPVIQIVSFGQAVADRYTYIPLIGIFYLLSDGILFLYTRTKRLTKILLSAALIFFLGFLSYHSHQRCKVWKNSLTLWSDVINKFPFLSKPYNNRGIICSEMKMFREALNDFNQAILRDPNLLEPYNNRGITYYLLKEYELAIEDFNRALDMDKNNFEIYNNRGKTYYAQGNYDKAMADFNHSLKINPGFASGYLNRGLLYLTLGKFENAISDFSEAIALNPFLFEPYNFRGSAYANLKKYKEAINDFTEALAINPNFHEAYNNRGIIYSYIGKFDSAIVDFSNAITLNPQFLSAYNNRGNAYASTGKLDSAIADFTKVLTLDSMYLDTYYNRALVYYMRKDYEKAFADLKKLSNSGYEIPLQLWNEVRDKLNEQLNK